MPEAVTRSKASPPTQKAPVPEARRETGAGPYLAVRYWKRMRIQKVYPVLVSFSGQGDHAPVAVRVVVAGAQVVPAEQVMDPSNPGEKATFYVTPLANGSLRGERVEVLQDGKKIQELRLPSTVTSQKGTLVWLFLAFFIPWLMLHYLEYSPIGYQTPLRDDGTEACDRKPWEKYKNMIYKKNSEELDPTRPSRKITDFIKDNTPDLKEYLGLDKDSGIQTFYDGVREFPEKTYLHLFERYHDLKLPLPLILFLVLLFMAFISFLLRTEARKSVYGRPLP
jgi:hypothetical protein